MRFPLFLLRLVFFGLLFLPGAKAAPGVAPGTDAAPPKLAVTIRAVNSEIKVGDAIPIECTLTNQGGADFVYWEGGGYWGRGDMGFLCSLSVSDAAGKPMASPYANDLRGFAQTASLVKQVSLPPGKSVTEISDLNYWALIRSPGNYTVTGNYQGRFTSNTITISVQPRSEKEMTAYVADLAARLHAATDLKTRADLIKKIMFTGSPQMVPALLDSMHTPRSGSLENEAFRFYLPQSPAIRKAILDDAAKRGLGEMTQGLLEWYGAPDSEIVGEVMKHSRVTAEEMYPLIIHSLAADNPTEWAAGALAAWRYPNDAFTPRLIAMANTPTEYEGSFDAITALISNRTDESVKALKDLLQSPDAKIRQYTADHIRMAYTDPQYYIFGHPLRPDDFDVDTLPRDVTNSILLNGTGQPEPEKKK